MRKSTLILFLFFSFCIILIGQSTWHWGIHTQMGLSGWPRTVEESGVVPFDNSTFSAIAKERIQPAFGGGAWLAVQPHQRWRFQFALGYRWASMVATRVYKGTGGFVSNDISQNGWRSQYFQLPVQAQYTWSIGKSIQPYIGLGLQPTYLWKHMFRSEGYFTSSFFGGPTGEVSYLNEEKADLTNEDLERSRFQLGFIGEFGLRIDRYILAVSTTQFFHEGRQGSPYYGRYLDYVENPDGTFDPIGTPLRYAGSIDVRFYYAFR